jgi:hypothetical protein
MKGKLILKEGVWGVQQAKTDNVFLPVKSDDLYRYHESFNNLDVDYELYLMNKSGRIFKNVDTSTNFSEAIWVVKIDESNFKWKNFAKNDVLVENDVELLINECWVEYKKTLQDSQYMARLNLNKSETDFKSGARLMYEKISKK